MKCDALPRKTLCGRFHKLSTISPRSQIIRAGIRPFGQMVGSGAVGVRLPCNLVVREDDQSAVHIEVVEPDVVLERIHVQVLLALAADVRRKLWRAMAAL